MEEAQVLAHINNSGIVNVYTCFEEHNTAYMVMEFVNDKSHAEVIHERGALPEEEAVGYIRQVGTALARVREQGLLHRGIKRGNIMLTNDGRPVLIDFGTAREFAPNKTGLVAPMLTEGYASPDQYRRKAQFGPYTDI